MTRRATYTGPEIIWMIEKETKANRKAQNKLAESMDRLNYWFNYLKRVDPETYKQIEEQAAAQQTANLAAEAAAQTEAVPSALPEISDEKLQSLD